MTGPATDPASGDGTGREEGPVSRAESRLMEAGILLQSIAADGGVRAGCAVQLGVVTFPLRSVDGSPIRIVEAHLRVPDHAEARFLAAVLWPDVTEPRIAGRWAWRGWIVGDSSSTPLSITLASDSDTAWTTPGGTQ